MLALPEISDGEPQPKQRKRSQLKQKLVGGVVVCRYCGDPLSGRMVFCQHKNPRCTQAFHRREAEQAQAAKAADDRRAAFQEGMQHQAASMELHAGQLLLTEKSSTVSWNRSNALLPVDGTISIFVSDSTTYTWRERWMGGKNLRALYQSH